MPRNEWLLAFLRANPFHSDDLDLFRAISQGQFTIAGFRKSDLRRLLPGTTSSRLGRMLS
jgi:hypothetical protein